MVDSEHVQPGNQTPNLEELQDKLDNLWESYLHFLDEYDQAQKQLNKHISKVLNTTTSKSTVATC